MSGEQATSRRSPRLTARGAATRHRIVAAAADLMYIQGVGATSLDGVIEASGTGKSQMYHYFADKDALVIEVVSTQIDRVLGFQDQHLRRLDSLRGLERWRDALISGNRIRGGGHGCPLGSLASELADRTETVRAALVDGFGAWEGLFATGFERMRVNGELDAAADAGVLASGLLAALQGGLLLAQTHRDPRRLEIALNMGIDQVRAHTAVQRAASAHPAGPTG